MQVERNPYSAPQANLQSHEAIADELPSRWIRLAGVFVDGIIGLVLTMPVMWYAGYFSRVMAGIKPSVTELAGWTVFGFVVFLAVHGWLLHTNGQTVGKRLVGTRIVDMASRGKPPFGKLVALRYFVPQLFYTIPVVGPIVAFLGILMIFRSDRRPLHDHLAGTQVVVVR